MSKSANYLSRTLGQRFGRNERGLTSVLSAFCAPSPPLSTEAPADELEEFKGNLIKFLPPGQTCLTNFYSFFEDDLSSLESLICVNQDFTEGQTESLRVAIIYAAAANALADASYMTLPEQVDSFTYEEVFARLSDPDGSVTGSSQTGDLYLFQKKLNRIEENHYKSKIIVFLDVSYIPEDRKYDTVCDGHGDMVFYVCPRAGTHKFLSYMSDVFNCAPFTPHSMSPAAVHGPAPGDEDEGYPVLPVIERAVTFSPSTVGEGEGSPRDELASSMSVYEGRNDVQRIDVSQFVGPSGKASVRTLHAQLERVAHSANKDVRVFNAMYKSSLAKKEGVPVYQTYRAGAAVYKLAADKWSIDELKSAIDTTFNRDQALEQMLKVACAEKNISANQHCASVLTTFKTMYHRVTGQQLQYSLKVNLAQLLAFLTLATEETCDSLNLNTAPRISTYLMTCKSVLSVIRTHKKVMVDYKHEESLLSNIVYETTH